MVLTDPSGVVLQNRRGSHNAGGGRRCSPRERCELDELVSGTNAIGTALSLKEPVQVHATEHFCAGIKPWSCSAVVLRDPAPARASACWTYQD